MSEEKIENKVTPRIHCFGGLRVGLNDVCDKSDECKLKQCMWHEERGDLPSKLGADDNRTEAMTRTSI